MSDSILLNWAIMAVSFFNTILLLWLGATVLLNAERRDWGIGLATGGLLLGGAFFVSHTAILGLFIGGHMASEYTAVISEGLLVIGTNMIFWWTAGLVPAIALPFAWYLIMLWYGGFWNERGTQSGAEETQKTTERGDQEVAQRKSLRSSRPLRLNASLHRRQRYVFWLVVGLLISGLAGLAIGIVLLAIPSQELINLRLFIRWSVAGIPFMALAYSSYVVLCIALSLDALRRPGPSSRVMGNEARQRARPYLIGASLALLVVSLLVAGILLWAVQETRHRMLYQFYDQAIETLARFDLLIGSILALVILLLGQAVVSYEVFTGKSLPRRGLMRHWRRAVVLAAGYSVPVGFSIAIALRPLYSLILTTILMTVFFALSSWRSYAERERYMDSLRPFVASQRLYDQLLTQSAPPEMDMIAPFRALCHDLLDAEVAFLTAVGPLAPLVPPLAYGAEIIPNVSDLVTQFISPQRRKEREEKKDLAPFAFLRLIPLEPSQYNGAIWAIPLWSERGLIGLLLLGRKRDGGLYTQEEINIARVSGERLIDTQASAEMARRLMSLQRERLAQSQVIDQRTRRVLHDDILPTIQTAMISLSGSGGNQEAINALTDAHRQISDLLHEMPTVAAPEVARLGLVEALRRSVENELAQAFDNVQWKIAPHAEESARAIPTLTAEVIFYAAREVVRNAAKHGRSPNTDNFCLKIQVNWQDGLEIIIADNGAGLQTPSPNSGSGQGLALHSTMMAVIGGELSVDSLPGQYTRVILRFNF
ncbi:MAG: hypothetical protein GY803_05700 [Chloroflexi bacterium]|nr:hypothetical protein [Chloroflexota bacterium]